MTLQIIQDVEEVEEVTPDENIVFEIKNYVDDEGRAVIGKTPVNGPTEVITEYIGSFKVGTSMGPVQLHMDFPEGCDLLDCFEQFDTLAQETIDKAQEEAREQQLIATPDQAMGNNSQIIT